MHGRGHLSRGVEHLHLCWEINVIPSTLMGMNYHNMLCKRQEGEDMRSRLNTLVDL